MKEYNCFKAVFFTDSPDLEFNLLGEFDTENMAHEFVNEFISSEYCHNKPNQYHWIRNKNIWSNRFDIIKIKPCPCSKKSIFE